MKQLNTVRRKNARIHKILVKGSVLRKWQMETNLEAAEKKRVVFTFDNHSYERLKELARARGGDMAQVLRESLELKRALERQIEDGFNQILVRNSKTNEERILTRGCAI